MATVYKSLKKSANASDSDSDMSDEIISEGRSSTVRADSSSLSDVEVDTTRLSQLPLELKSRILMLTSRGVSFRYHDIALILPIITDNLVDIDTS